MGDKVKVLVVDDDRRMVRTICDILRVKGYEAVPAYSGEEGVDKVKGESFDCVLMDIKMPGIDGVEALQMIRKTVLVVDDDPVFCKTLKDILQTQGYQVETETEPGNVLRRMERNEMAVVVL